MPFTVNFSVELDYQRCNICNAYYAIETRVASHDCPYCATRRLIALDNQRRDENRAVRARDATISRLRGVITRLQRQKKGA